MKSIMQGEVSFKDEEWNGVSLSAKSLIQGIQRATLYPSCNSLPSMQPKKNIVAGSRNVVCLLGTTIFYIIPQMIYLTPSRINAHLKS